MRLKTSQGRSKRTVNVGKAPKRATGGAGVERVMELVRDGSDVYVHLHTPTNLDDGWAITVPLDDLLAAVRKLWLKLSTHTRSRPICVLTEFLARKRQSRLVPRNGLGLFPGLKFEGTVNSLPANYDFQFQPPHEVKEFLSLHRWFAIFYITDVSSALVGYARHT
jgi:hypothetical protein